MKKTILTFILLAAAATARLQAGLITFDDLPGSVDYVPDGYAGMHWDNALFVAPADLGLVPSGYQAGLVSGTKVLTNAYESPLTFSSSLSTFKLDSLWLTGAWNNKLKVHLEGYRAGVLLYKADYQVDSTSPSFVTPGFLDVDSVVVSSYAGEPNYDYASLGGAGTNLVIDNVSITPIPEVSTYGLCGAAGLLGLVLCRRYSRRT